MDSAMAYAVSEISADRLILGIPFYGYDWNMTAGPPARALRYRDTKELLARTSATPTIDRATSSATFSYVDEGERHEVWYEDDRSIAPKLNLVRKYGLRGVGAWRLGQEDPSAWVVWEQMLAVPSFTTSARLP
jgi:spore germination protein YaaH